MILIPLSSFTYTAAQRDEIKAHVRDRLGVNVEQVWPQPLDRIEVTVSMYRFQSDSIRQRPRRDDLIALHEDAANMQARIIDALTVRIAASSLTRNGVSFGMVSATRNYFTKLLPDLDRQIARDGSPPSQNARKIARDQCWNELLTIWCDLGGKPHGTAAAHFLMVTSQPVMPDEVRSLPTIMQWLERRRTKNAKQKTEPLPRRAIG